MTPALSDIQIVKAVPPTIQCQYYGESITIRLDTSAMLKLEGSKRSPDTERVLHENMRLIQQAAERLLKMHSIDSADQSVITVSALDLDPPTHHTS